MTRPSHSDPDTPRFKSFYSKTCNITLHYNYTAHTTYSNFLKSLSTLWYQFVYEAELGLKVIDEYQFANTSSLPLT